MRSRKRRLADGQMGHPIRANRVAQLKAPLQAPSNEVEVPGRWHAVLSRQTPRTGTADPIRSATILGGGAKAPLPLHHRDMPP